MITRAWLHDRASARTGKKIGVSTDTRQKCQSRASSTCSLEPQHDKANRRTREVGSPASVQLAASEKAKKNRLQTKPVLRIICPEKAD